MTYINIDGKFFDSTREKARKDEIASSGEEDSDSLLWEDLKEETRIEEINEDGSINLVYNSDLGYISLVAYLDDDDLVRLVNIAIKKMNKLKSVLESLK